MGLGEGEYWPLIDDVRVRVVDTDDALYFRWTYCRSK